MQGCVVSRLFFLQAKPGKPLEVAGLPRLMLRSRICMLALRERPKSDLPSRIAHLKSFFSNLAGPRTTHIVQHCKKLPLGCKMFVNIGGSTAMLPTQTACRALPASSLCSTKPEKRNALPLVARLGTLSRRRTNKSPVGISSNASNRRFGCRASEKKAREGP